MLHYNITMTQEEILYLTFLEISDQPKNQMALVAGYQQRLWFHCFNYTPLFFAAARRGIEFLPI